MWFIYCTLEAEKYRSLKKMKVFHRILILEYIFKIQIRLNEIDSRVFALYSWHLIMYHEAAQMPNCQILKNQTIIKKLCSFNRTIIKIAIKKGETNTLKKNSHFY